MEEKNTILSMEDFQILVSELGSELKRIRRHQEFTMKEVVERVGNGLTKSRLSLIENGIVGDRISFAVYLRLFAFYGLELSLSSSKGSNKFLLLPLKDK